MIEALRSKSSVIRKHAATRLRETSFHRIEGTEKGGEEAYNKWLAWWKENKLPKYATHEGLERLKGGNDVLSILLIAESADLGNPQVRAAAVAVLSTMPGERAEAAFRRCLNSSDEMVCISAINAILAGKLTDYVKDLEKLAKNSKSEAVHLKVLHVIEQLRKN